MQRLGYFGFRISIFKIEGGTARRLYKHALAYADGVGVEMGKPGAIGLERIETGGQVGGGERHSLIDGMGIGVAYEVEASKILVETGAGERVGVGAAVGDAVESECGIGGATVDVATTEVEGGEAVGDAFTGFLILPSAVGLVVAEEIVVVVGEAANVGDIEHGDTWVVGGCGNGIPLVGQNVEGRQRSGEEGTLAPWGSATVAVTINALHLPLVTGVGGETRYGKRVFCYIDRLPVTCRHILINTEVVDDEEIAVVGLMVDGNVARLPCILTEVDAILNPIARSSGHRLESSSKV